MQSENHGQEKIKIVYLITKGVWGGAQKYVFNLAVSLPKDKYEVTVICGEGKILKQKLESNNISVIELESLKRDISIHKEFLSFIFLLRKIKKIKPHVLHLNSPKAGGIGAIIGRILRTPKIIYTVHGFSWNEDRSPFQKILITLFTWVTILLSNKTITIASKEYTEAKELYLVPDEKIVLIRNGVEKIDFLDKEKAREELSRLSGSDLNGKFLIGTISELTKNKGYEYVISALSKVNSPFVFISLGGGELEKELRQTIERYEMKDKIYLLGATQDASKYLKAFDIFTLTSIKEGLPYAIIEAGLAGVPVVASFVGGIPDIIDNGKNGILVTKGKPGEITRAIEYLIEKPNERKEFAEKLKEKMQQDFSLDGMLEKTEKLYN